MIAGIKVVLGGVERVVPPLNLGALIELKDRLAAFRPGEVDTGSVDTLLECLYRALRRNYPEITKEEIAEHVDLGNMVELMQAVMDVSGLRRKKAEAEEQKQGEGQTSSGGQT
jgi:hypothetical protein